MAIADDNERLRALRRSRARKLSESRRLTGQAGDIMQAARKLYETKGVAATTVKDIAAEAGITRELVYYYFANKKGSSVVSVGEIPA